MEDDYDDEFLGRARVVNEELNAVLQRAKDRKLEEMKRYEMQQQLEATKLKKVDGENKDNKVNIYLIYIKKHLAYHILDYYCIVFLFYFLIADLCYFRIKSS